MLGFAKNRDGDLLVSTVRHAFSEHAYNKLSLIVK